MTARCPICTEELPDANAVRRHTLVAHGTTTPGSPGQWSPVTGPAEEGAPTDVPGWHADPWNASSLRWWDGTQWSGKTAPLGSAPAESAPARARRQVSAPAPLIGGVAVVLVIVVIIAVVISGNHSKARTVVTSPTVTLAPIPTTAPPAAGPGLAAGLLAASDLPGGWTVKTAPVAMAAREYTAGPCDSPLWAHDVSGSETVLADGGGSLLQNAEVDSRIIESASSSATAAQEAYAMSPSFVDCAKAEVIAGVQSELSNDPSIQLGDVTADPLNLSLSTPNVGFVLDVSLVDPSLGVGTFVADDHIELFQGVYDSSLDIITLSSNPIADTLVQTEASAAATRLASLPAGGTLHAGAV